MTHGEALYFLAGYLLAITTIWVSRRTLKFEHHFTMRIVEASKPDDPADYWKDN